jgi:EAL domain-containing protein (putative c-di-GMP-specific phosphodiesterase class I)
MEHCGSLWVSVNLSPLQLRNPHSMAGIHTILDDPAVEPEHLVLEITETALVADIEGVRASLERLKAAGVRLAVDDFGSGFSALSTLATLPVDILKIDRSFVSGQTATSSSARMLEGIVGLADKLALVVIAEGIETPEQLDMLRSLGCSMGQGYFLGRPIPANELEPRLARGGMVEVGEPTI